MEWVQSNIPTRQPGSEIDTSVWVKQRIHLNGSNDAYARITSDYEEYPVNMVYNMDETGLFSRMGANRTYLLRNEGRATVCGTELQEQKPGVTAVFCINADGSHALPMRYTGKIRISNCFPDPRFSHHSNFYTSQSKPLMDSVRFVKWIKWWHDEAH